MKYLNKSNLSCIFFTNKKYLYQKLSCTYLLIDIDIYLHVQKYTNEKYSASSKNV